MTDHRTQSLDLLTTYLHLPAGTGAVPVPVGEDFWATIGGRADLLDGRLVTLFHYGGDWPTWERHPAGEELVFLLDGAADLILEEGGGERVVELRGRAACLVPRGVWHRAVVHTPGDVLHITPGAGTEHRPV